MTLRLLLAMLLVAAAACAQDPFEIQVYQYITVPKGMWNLETHANYVGDGVRRPEGTVVPTHNQFHLTYELTHGITSHFELAGYLVTARRPGRDTAPLEFVAWRVRPRFRLPQSWKLPVDISLSTEIAFPRDRYDENAATLEVRPIFERNFGRWQFCANPVIGRALRGPGTKDGWDFEPSMRIGFRAIPSFDATLEYYGAVGAITGFAPTHEQVHLLFPGWDLRFGQNVVWNFGVGFAATPAGNQVVYKMRLGVLFGRQK